MTTRRILLLNGPNLDMLGVREPEVYGHETLATLEQTVRMHAEQRGVALTCFQSNSEGKLVNKIHKAPGAFDGIVYNPGAHTHYSYALRDAVASIDVPVVEVHLSDIDDREPFRSISVIAPACIAQVKGLGVGGYCRAVDIILERDGLLRLGEGFESRFEPQVNERIAGRETIGVGGASRPARIAQSEGRPAGLASGGGMSGGAWAGRVFDGAPADPSSGATPTSNARAVDVHEDELDAPTCAVADIDAGRLSAKRQDTVRDACKQLGVGAMLVRDTPNIRWITAFDGVFDEERAHALLITPEQACLHTDSRYSNALRTAAAATGSSIDIDESRVNHFAFARKRLEADDAGKTFGGTLGFEDTVTYAEFVKAAAEFGTDRLVPTSDIVLSLRAVKDSSELQRLRAAQAITDAAFAHIVEFMRPGMAECEVQLELESFMLRHGADGLAFGSIVACGENGADPHAIPTTKKLEAGQCVVMDFGARAYGYCSDMTRVVFLGEPHGAMAQAWHVLRQANETVEAMLRPGVTGREAHEAAERVLAEGGFAGRMGHGLGHGVGLECHELPVLNTRNDAPLVEGNVVTVEPGIYIPGEFGMRLEDCGVITAGGYDVFSQLGHEMVVI